MKKYLKLEAIFYVVCAIILLAIHFDFIGSNSIIGGLFFPIFYVTGWRIIGKKKMKMTNRKAFRGVLKYLALAVILGFISKTIQNNYNIYIPTAAPLIITFVIMIIPALVYDLREKKKTKEA